MVSIGVIDDPINQGYDIISTAALIINLLGSILYTFDSIRVPYIDVLNRIEAVTVFFFAIDYILRLITASELYPKKSVPKAVFSYIKSFYGIVDLLSFLPYYLPVFFPGGIAAFRMIRVVRILRLFRINAYYDSLNVIAEVLIRKKNQLFACVFIIGTLMLASSLCMYSLEHEAQPEVFKNAFSGLWWAASTLLTVGYGDIYPVTPIGRLMGVIITFLGVGIVAIPTGIISAGFVEHYSILKRFGDYSKEHDIHFIELTLGKNDDWTGRQIKDLGLPSGAIIAVIIRNKKRLLPRANTELRPNDTLIIGAERTDNMRQIDFTEIEITKDNPWNGMAIKNIDISRDSLIVMVKRRDKTKIPRAELILLEGDTVYIYSEADD
ncbi:MAG: ion transporter [Lachnospiraceae bacterium]|nr:ion transporter [Lachnospiraceae bacterium]